MSAQAGSLCMNRCARRENRSLLLVIITKFEAADLVYCDAVIKAIAVAFRYIPTYNGFKVYKRTIHGRSIFLL